MLFVLLLVACCLLLVAVVGCGNSDTSPDEQATNSQSQTQAGDPIVNSIGMSLVQIPAGTFTMGDANGQDDETPHQVTLTKGFELGVYEVTQEQYEAVMGTNPSDFKGPQNPVEEVSWNDAVEFCRKLSALPSEKSAGYVYRLPTEAEWEYACRAGTKTAYSFGDSESELGDYAWFGDNSGDQQIDALNIWNTDADNYFDRIVNNNCRTHPVGGKQPNAWGLYDMHGNVWEWCQDWYGDYPKGSTTDPTGAASGSDRVLRGGSWGLDSDYCRSAFRNWDAPDNRSINFGFRVLRSSVK
jgi:formylglycine-generating enzyme required for sulfatase activity